MQPSTGPIQNNDQVLFCATKYWSYSKQGPSTVLCNQVLDLEETKNK